MVDLNLDEVRTKEDKKKQKTKYRDFSNINGKKMKRRGSENNIVTIRYIMNTF